MLIAKAFAGKPWIINTPKAYRKEVDGIAGLVQSGMMPLIRVNGICQACLDEPIGSLMERVKTMPRLRLPFRAAFFEGEASGMAFGAFVFTGSIKWMRQRGGYIEKMLEPYADENCLTIQTFLGNPGKIAGPTHDTLVAIDADGFVGRVPEFAAREVNPENPSAIEGRPIILPVPTDRFDEGLGENDKKRLLSAEQKVVFTTVSMAIQSIAMLNAKNIDMREGGNLRDGLTKRQAKEDRVPSLAYKTLFVRKDGKSTSVDSIMETAVNGRMPLHMVRGHFRDYSQGKGLFGKYNKESVWIPPHVKGRVENGQVIKDYTLDKETACTSSTSSTSSAPSSLTAP